MAKRGHIRVGRAFGKEVQERILREHGVTILYVDDPESAVKATRAGEVLYAVGMRGLAGSKPGIVAAVRALHAKGAAAADVETGRRTDGKDGLELMAEAAMALTAERMGGHKAAKKFGRMGGTKSGKNRADRKTPLATCEKHWFDKSLSNPQVVEKCNSYGYPDDWTYGALYNHFGARGVKTGRPASKR